MKTLLKRFFSNERGLELVEYGVITALLTVTLLVALGLLSAAIGDRFTQAGGLIGTDGHVHKHGN